MRHSCGALVSLKTHSLFFRVCRPTDFSYKPDSRQNSMFVVAPLWDDSDDESHMWHLRELLENDQLGEKLVDVFARSYCIETQNSVGNGHATIHVIRPLILRIRNRRRFEKLQNRIAAILRDRKTEDKPIPSLAKWTGVVSSELRAEVRHSLARNLFGIDWLYRERLRFAISDACFVS